MGETDGSFALRKNDFNKFKVIFVSRQQPGWTHLLEYLLAKVRLTTDSKIFSNRKCHTKYRKERVIQGNLELLE